MICTQNAVFFLQEKFHELTKKAEEIKRDQMKAIEATNEALMTSLNEMKCKELQKAEEMLEKFQNSQELLEAIIADQDSEELKQLIELSQELAKVNKYQEDLEAKLTTFDISSSSQLIMKKKVSRKTSSSSATQPTLALSLTLEENKPHSAPPVVIHK